MTTYAAIEAFFACDAATELYGEDVTIAEHMLQTAAAASADGADDELVVASLLHDVGHFADNPDNDDLGNRHHADAGAAMLEQWFGAGVTGPIRLHVAAKRYLVATEPGYGDRLSPASVATLAQQGGAFAPPEIEAFLSEPHAEAAVSLRRFDDAGKEAGVVVAPLADYRDLIDSLTR